MYVTLYQNFELGTFCMIFKLDTKMPFLCHIILFRFSYPTLPKRLGKEKKITTVSFTNVTTESFLMWICKCN